MSETYLEYGETAALDADDTIVFPHLVPGRAYMITIANEGAGAVTLYSVGPNSSAIMRSVLGESVICPENTTKSWEVVIPAANQVHLHAAEDGASCVVDKVTRKDNATHMEIVRSLAAYGGLAAIGFNPRTAFVNPDTVSFSGTPALGNPLAPFPSIQAALEAQVAAYGNTGRHHIHLLSTPEDYYFNADFPTTVVDETVSVRFTENHATAYVTINALLGLDFDITGTPGIGFILSAVDSVMGVTTLVIDNARSFQADFGTDAPTYNTILDLRNIPTVIIGGGGRATPQTGNITITLSNCGNPLSNIHLYSSGDYSEFNSAVVVMRHSYIEFNSPMATTSTAIEMYNSHAGAGSIAATTAYNSSVVS